MFLIFLNEILPRAKGKKQFYKSEIKKYSDPGDKCTFIQNSRFMNSGLMTIFINIRNTSINNNNRKIGTKLLSFSDRKKILVFSET